MGAQRTTKSNEFELVACIACCQICLYSWAQSSFTYATKRVALHDINVVVFASLQRKSDIDMLRCQIDVGKMVHYFGCKNAGCRCMHNVHQASLVHIPLFVYLFCNKNGTPSYPHQSSALTLFAKCKFCEVSLKSHQHGTIKR